MSRLKQFISEKPKVLKTSLAIGGLAVIMSTSIFLTSAYLTAETNSKTNLFQPYTLTDTQIYEPNTDYQIKEASSYSVDGKTVTVQNPYGTDKKPVYVRMIATVSGKSTGEVVDEVTIDSLTTAKILDGKTLNEDYWVKGDDGYYYYKYVLYPGYQTQELFKNGKIYISKNEDITITFTTDTVQAWANGKRGVINTSFASTAWSTPFSDLLQNGDISATNDSDKNVEIT